VLVANGARPAARPKDAPGRKAMAAPAPAARPASNDPFGALK
jgi:hypothetical protein